MLRKSAAAVAVVLCLANANAIRADPGPVVNWLMDEPASLFDVGMSRLEREIERKFEIRDRQREVTSSVHYNWDRNRIYIWANIFWLQKPKEDQMTKFKDDCKSMIGDLRQVGGINRKTGGYNVTPSVYSWSFQHFGYQTTSAPEDFQTRLDKIITLGVLVAAMDFTEPRVQCRGPLVSNKVYFEE